MSDTTKILKIIGRKFYYTENDCVEINHTNIPIGKMSFKYGREIYWEVELFNYDITSQTIGVRVLNYSPENISSFYQQKQRRPVKYFSFEKFEWSKIESQLSSYQISELSDIMEGISSLSIRNNENFDITEKYIKLDIEPSEDSGLSNDRLGFIGSQIVRINEEFSFYYKNANFKDGYVSVDFKPQLCSKKEEIRIINNKILSEFHYVRNYFPKYFKKGKKFYVLLRGEVQFGKLISYEAISEEIQSINENVISTVKDLIHFELFDTIDSEKFAKNILSIEELIEESHLNGTIKKSLDKEPQKILNSIFKIKDVKNKNQLEYLAGFKQQDNYQMRFTLKPLFGFLFYVESDKENHFCWELLNSHATYIWSFDSKYNFFEKLTELDNIINYIKINGREKYKQLIKTEGNKSFTFSTIYHKYKLTKVPDGFVEWKKELEKIMKTI